MFKLCQINHQKLYLCCTVFQIAICINKEFVESFLKGGPSFLDLPYDLKMSAFSTTVQSLRVMIPNPQSKLFSTSREAISPENWRPYTQASHISLQFSGYQNSTDCYIYHLGQI